MNLSGLSGLSAAYPGYIKAEGDEATAHLKQLAAADAENQQIGGQAFARAFMAEVPGAAPLPPAPGQSSMPRSPQGGMQPPMGGGQPPVPQGGGMASQGGPQGAPPPMQGGGMQLGGQQPMGGGQGRMGTMDINELAQKIIRANPGIEKNPGHLMGALQQALPFMTAQSKAELAQLQQQYKLEQANTARERLDETSAHNKEIERLRGEGETRRKEHEDRMGEQFKATQERLKENARNRYNESHARLERMISRDMTSDQKYAAAKDIDIAKQELTTQHRTIMEQIAANNMLNAADRDRLLKESAKNRDDQLAKLEELRARMRTNSSPAATVPNKDTAKAPAGDPLALPQEAIQQLKEGVVTTFGNGQKWTLEGGKPKKVE